VTSRGMINLHDAPLGTTILILGAGIAGGVAQSSIRNVGYSVKELGMTSMSTIGFYLLFLTVLEVSSIE
jgi:hypothetical protein